MFASGCSPPRVAATQLPLATRERASPGEGTFTPQFAPASRRADSGFRRNDENRPFHTFYAIIKVINVNSSDFRKVIYYFFSVGDVDRRGIHCFAISEKTRAIGGGVREGIFLL